MLQKILDFFFDLRYNTNSCFGEQVTHNIRRCTQVVEGVGFKLLEVVGTQFSANPVTVRFSANGANKTKILF